MSCTEYYAMIFIETKKHQWVFFCYKKSTGVPLFLQLLRSLPSYLRHRQP